MFLIFVRIYLISLFFWKCPPRILDGFMCRLRKNLQLVIIRWAKTSYWLLRKAHRSWLVWIFFLTNQVRLFLLLIQYWIVLLKQGSAGCGHTITVRYNTESSNLNCLQLRIFRELDGICFCPVCLKNPSGFRNSIPLKKDSGIIYVPAMTMVHG